jgi:AbrB family looped-hinge helix DNA binding protein
MIDPEKNTKQGREKNNKNLFLKEMKEKFVEEPPSIYSVSTPEGLEPCPPENERVKSIKKVKNSRGIAADKPMRSHIRSIYPHDLSRELVTVDRSGRLVLPKKIRNLFDANRFEVKVMENHIELVPVKPIRSLLGILPDLNLEAIYRDHDREVAEEDEE